MHQATRHRAPLTGPLSLGIIPTIAPYLLPHLLPALQMAYPLLDLRLKEDVTARQMDALKAGQIDVVLMALPYDTPHMEQMRLWKEPFFLARAGDQLSCQEQIALDDLQNETILLLDDGHCLRDHILSACRLAATSGHRKTLGATSLQTLIQMVQNGYGSTLLPSMAIDPQHIPIRGHHPALCQSATDTANRPCMPERRIDGPGVFHFELSDETVLPTGGLFFLKHFPKGKEIGDGMLGKN